jgi:hypothetical protein
MASMAAQNTLPAWHGLDCWRKGNIGEERDKTPKRQIPKNLK